MTTEFQAVTLGHAICYKCGFIELWVHPRANVGSPNVGPLNVGPSMIATATSLGVDNMVTGWLRV